MRLPGSATREIPQNVSLRNALSTGHPAMSHGERTPETTDPFVVLGLSADCSEAELRARYLELVKRHPPEREPEKFRQLHRAYEAARDPLVVARNLYAEPPEDVRPWRDIVKEQENQPPRLPVKLLLSLGNQSKAHSQ